MGGTPYENWVCVIRSGVDFRQKHFLIQTKQKREQSAERTERHSRKSRTTKQQERDMQGEGRVP
jgi:hypothetical protein